jgi:peptidyl-prolyl cis-trans isomerase C
MRRIPVVVLVAAAALAACKPAGSGGGKNAVIAQGRGVTVTAEDFKAKLDEQSPFLRARYTTLERKKEFLDQLVRLELLAREAERAGLARDPEVQAQLKRIMVQKLVQKKFADTSGMKDIPEADLRKYYDEHKEQYFRPARVRLALIAWNAPASGPERTKKVQAAKKAAAKLQAEEKKNALAFSKGVADYSEDPSKAAAGDIGFKTRDEVEKAYGKAIADAVLALKDGETTSVLENEKGIYLFKLTGRQDEVNRSFDQMKPQIQNTVFREKRSKEFDEYLKKLRNDAGVKVDDKALDALDVAAGAPAVPGMAPMGPHGMGMGGGAMPRPMPMQPAPAGAAQPAPAAAPVPAPAK